MHARTSGSSGLPRSWTSGRLRRSSSSCAGWTCRPAGVWNATSSLWQRYDAPWDGVGGTRGEAKLLGSIAVMYDSPHRHEITIYKVTVSENGLDQGWTVESLCDDALIWAGLTIATCPRAELTSPPVSDPFRLRDGRRAP